MFKLLALIAVAAICAWVYVDYRRDIGRARAELLAGSRIAQTACGPIEYASLGEGPPVLLVHGAGGGYDQGLAIGGPLAREGFRVIAMSRFGYLRTPLPADASAAAQADAHACLLDALGIERAAIMGASAGAPSALQFALRHPRRCAALVLLVPAIFVPRPDGAPPVTTPPGTQFLFDTALRSDFLFWAGIKLARATMIRALLATPPEVVANADPGEQRRVDAILRQILPVSPRRLGLLNDAAVTSTLPRYPLDQVAVPTLAISLADDLFGTYDGARYTAAQVPGARFIGYPTGGHVGVGHERDFVLAIASFLR